MTTTTMSLSAVLRTLADHVEKHDLSSNSPNIRYSKVGTVIVHAYDVADFASWAGSLTDVSTKVVVHEGDPQVFVTGRAGDLDVELITVLTPRREAAERRKLLALLSDPKSTNYQSIELPEFLGGKR